LAPADAQLVAVGLDGVDSQKFSVAWYVLNWTAANTTPAPARTANAVAMTIIFLK
jgi:hypothetical protein